MSANILIIILTCIVSYYGFNNRPFFEKLKHFPFQEQRDKSFSRLLTAGFLHGSWLHLLINMFVLYSFGDIVETGLLVPMYGEAIGRTIYILMYLAIIVLANIPTFLKHKNNPGFASIGASGAVSGIIFIFILMYPWEKIYLYGVIGIYSIVAGIIYLVYSSWASKNSKDHIDHDAHFYGAVFGLIIIIALEPRLVNAFIQQITNVPQLF